MILPLNLWNRNKPVTLHVNLHNTTFLLKPKEVKMSNWNLVWLEPKRSTPCTPRASSAESPLTQVRCLFNPLQNVCREHYVFTLVYICIKN